MVTITASEEARASSLHKRALIIDNFLRVFRDVLEQEYNILTGWRTDPSADLFYLLRRKC